MKNSSKYGVLSLKIKSFFRFCFVFVLGLAIFTLLVSCSDLNDNTKKSDASESRTGACIVSGNLLVDGVFSSRSANTSFKITSSDCKWLARAMYIEDDTLVVSGSVNTTAMTYSFKLEKLGEWKLDLLLETKDEEGKILLKSDEVIVTVSDSDLLITKDIVFYPSYEAAVPGAINLKIKDSSGKLSYVSYYGYCMDDLEPEEMENIPFKETKIAPFGTNHIATIELDSVPATSYEVTFCFKDEKGNTLYQCTETITVFSGFTTDIWLGESPYMTKNANGTYSLEITQDLIDSFGAEIVPNTKIMLYEYGEAETDPELPANSEYGYEYYLVDDSGVGTKPVESAVPSVFTMYSSNDFTCFDSEGNLYLLQITEDYGSSLKASN